MNETALVPQRFLAVWERVNAAHAPVEDAPAMLEKLISAANERRTLYSGLAASLPSFAKKLRFLAAREKRALSALQTEYFLLTGDTCPPFRARAGSDPPLKALRSCFLSENRSRSALEVASHSSGERQSGIFAALAKEAGENSDTVAAILSRMFS